MNGKFSGDHLVVWHCEVRINWELGAGNWEQMRRPVPEESRESGRIEGRTHHYQVNVKMK